MEPPDAARRRRRAGSADAAPASDAAAAAARARVLQRPRRLRRRRARVRDDPRRGAVDAGAVDQRGRQRRRSASRSPSRGAGYTWAVNSRENQLTPWSNDPVGDPPGRGDLRPRRGRRASSGARRRCRSARSTRPYVVRHGQGYSRFEHTSHGIALELLQFVPLDDPIKISRLRARESLRADAPAVGHGLRRVGARHVAQRAPRRSSSPRSTPRPARCSRATPGSAEFGEPRRLRRPRRPPDRVDRRPHGVPRPQRHARPPGRARAAAHAVRNASAPASIRAARCRPTLELRAGRARRGRLPARPGGDRRRGARARSRATATADLDATLARGRRGAGTTCSARVQVRTPDRSLDLLLNRWLLYQTLACRVWARAAFYQASGAYGFRDQLQDVMALTVAQPRRSRASICCAPPRGSSSRATCSTGGIRRRAAACARASPTTCVWLPYAAAHYVEVDRRRGDPRRAACRSSRGRRCAPGEARRVLRSPTVAERDARRSSSTARARSTAASPSARTACR